MKNLIMVIALLLALPGSSLAAENLIPQNAPAISALEAYDLLNRDPERVFLIDVRPQTEYAAGHPAKAYNIPWRFAGNEVTIDGNGTACYKLNANTNPDFIGVVSSLFKTSDQLFILCDNGTQSAQASDALLAAGFAKVAQVRDGVWGTRFTSAQHPRLAEKYSASFGKGGLTNGWVYWGLPMSYNLNPLYLYPPDVKRAQEAQ